MLLLTDKLKTVPHCQEIAMVILEIKRLVIGVWNSAQICPGELVNCRTDDNFAACF